MNLRRKGKMTMPKRTKQHQVEDESINKFKLLLPEQWVYREKDRDYGIDGEVEIFDENGFATGVVFLVQLKSTYSKDIKLQKRVKLSVSSISYYKKLELPVLIIRYVKETEAFYYRWAEEIDFYYIKEGAKTYSFNYDEKEQWSENSIQVIKNRLINQRKFKNSESIFPIKTLLDFDFDVLLGCSKQELKSLLRKEINKYSRIIKTTLDSHDCIAKIIIDKKDITVNMLGVNGFYLHDYKESDYQNLEHFFADVLTAYSIALMYFNKYEQGQQLFKDYIAKSNIKLSIDIMFFVIKLFISQRKIKECYDLWELIPDKVKDDFSNSMFFAMMMFPEANYESNDDGLEAFLLKQIAEYQTNPNQDIIGAVYYNYANFLRSRGRNKESFKNYLKAARLNQTYTVSAYFFKELGGILFDLERYCVSAKCYKKGLDLEFDNKTLALYSDALMMSGQYLLAIKYFKKHLEATNDINFEWFLKFELLKYIRRKYGIRFQNRKPSRIANSSYFEKPGAIPKSSEELLPLVEYDVLSPILMFNLGVNYNHEKNYDDAFASFLLCAISNRNDVESWKNTFGSAFNANVLQMIEPILYVGCDCCGEEFLSEVYAIIKDMRKTVPAQVVDDLSELINEIGQKVYDRKNKPTAPTIRVNNGDKFINIQDILIETDES